MSEKALDELYRLDPAVGTASLHRQLETGRRFLMSYVARHDTRMALDE